MRGRHFKAGAGMVMAVALLSGTAAMASAPAAMRTATTGAKFTTHGSASGKINSKGDFSASITGAGAYGAATTTKVTGKLGKASVKHDKSASASTTGTATPSSTTPGAADFQTSLSSKTMSATVSGNLSPSGSGSSIAFRVSIDCEWTSQHGWTWTITIGWTAAGMVQYSTHGSASGKINSKGDFSASIPGTGANKATSTAQVTGRLGKASVAHDKAASASTTGKATPSSTNPGSAVFQAALSSKSMQANVTGSLSPSGSSPGGSTSSTAFDLRIRCTYSDSGWEWTITISWAAASA